VPLQLTVSYAQREALEIWPRTIACGELPEGVEPRKFEIMAYSMTRSAANFPAPVAAVNGNDPTITIGSAIPMTAEECERFAYRLAAEFKGPVRVLSGYRFPVT